MISRLLARKSPNVDTDSSQLKRTLGAFDLTLLGIGAIIGTGIFVLTGTAAAGGENHIGAGPAIVLSFLITALACSLAALCYAEFASMIPVSGSAYTYAYASFGELVAWIIGWDLILEYAVGNIAIAIGWSGYMLNLLHFMGIYPPAWLCIDPMTAAAVLKAEAPNPDTLLLAQEAMKSVPDLGFKFMINLPAMLIVGLVSFLLFVGVKESARVNSIIVMVKFAMIALFLFFGVQHLDFTTHWQNFAPNGFNGIMTGAAIIFFAYIGFDAVSTTAEEAKNPQRDLPIGMLASLAVCTVLYVAVATVLTGMAPLSVLSSSKPVAAALTHVNANTVANVISLGAVLSITSVLLVMQYGQTRIFFAMSRDGLLPKALSRVHPKFQTPHWCTVISGFLIAIPAGLIDINIAAEVSNIGTLFAFILVAFGIMILRVTNPERARRFKTPFVWVVGPGCVITCVALMYYLTPVTWIRFGIWMAIGLVVYFLYGYHRSNLATPAPQNTEAAPNK